MTICIDSAIIRAWGWILCLPFDSPKIALTRKENAMVRAYDVMMEMRDKNGVFRRTIRVEAENLDEPTAQKKAQNEAVKGGDSFIRFLSTQRVTHKV